MSAINCITDSKKATEKLKKRLKDQIEEVIKDAKETDNVKVSVGIRKLTAEAAEEAKAKRIKNIKHAWRYQQIADQVTNHPKGRYWGAAGLIEADPYLAANRNGNYMDSKNVWQAKLYSEGGKEMSDLRDTWSGAVKSLFTNKRRAEIADGLIKHWSGQQVNDPVVIKIAAGWQKIAQASVKYIRQQGGSLAEIPNYKPQPLSTERLFSGNMLGGKGQLVIPESEFLADFIPAVDRSIPNPVTNKPWTDAELKAAASEYYKTLVTDGANKKRPGWGKGGLEVAHSIERVFNYTPAGWGKLMQKYGPPDIVNNLFSYVDRAASDLAELSTWGPRPRAMREQVEQLVRESGDKEGADRLSELWGIASGQNGLGYRTTIGALGTGTRSLAMATQLGGTVVISLIGDLRNAMSLAIRNNASFREFFRNQYQRVLNKEDGFDYALEQLQVWESGFANMESFLRRMGDHQWIQNKTSRRAGAVLNSSGLGHITDANRFATQDMLELSLAKHWGKSFADVEKRAPDLAIKLKEWGVDKHWDALGKVPLRDVPGSKFDAKTVDYAKLFESDPAAALALKQYVIGETRRTIISSNALGERILQMQNPSGSVAGETFRTLFQYMRYPAANWYAYWMPLMMGQGTRGITRAKLAAWQLTSAVIGGVFYNWLTDLRNGRTPEPIINDEGELNWKMLVKGMLQMDIVPHLGTMLMKWTGIDDPYKWDEPSRYDDKSALGKVIEAVPVGSLLYKLGKETVADPISAAFSDDRTVKEELGGALREVGKTVGSMWGLNTWLSSYAFGRLILDQIEAALDPDGYANKRERYKARLEDRGQRELFETP